MKEHRRTGPVWAVAAAAIAATVATVVAPAAADNGTPTTSYLHEDAVLRGREIHAFQDDGQTVSVLLGDFELRIGQRTLTGRDAVVWVHETPFGKAVRHDIVVYVEGSARLEELDGTVTQDRWMLVTVHQQGRLDGEGRLSREPLRDFPLYRRAVERRVAAARAAEAGRQRVPREAPRLVPGTVPAPPSEGQSPPDEATPAEGEPEPDEAAPPESMVPAQPVGYAADSTRTIWIGEGENRQQAILVKGHVYLSQGQQETQAYLEVRANAAVLFIQKRPAAEDPARVPYRPDLGAGPEGQRITGAYLEGDVIITYGERMLRGDRAYYDFTGHRALVLDAVFRTVQEQRNIPVYVRAREARMLSIREMQFRDARVSTSEFYTPTYHVGAQTAYLMDTAEYDLRGVRVTPQKWRSDLKHATFGIRGLPVLYTPRMQSDFEEGHIALRKVQAGRSRGMGWGVDTEWHLFRLLGLVEPPGVSGRFELNWHEDGPEMGVNVRYRRERYSGYALAYGVLDDEQEDDFGEEREDIPANYERGRVLLRHKHTLPKDWKLQFELSYLCDRNYLEKFFPNEFHAGKEQETLLYAKKQQDNWAFTSLIQGRLNRFQSQGESYPDLGFHLIGEPLAGDALSFFSESHLGLKRYAYDNALHRDPSHHMLRADTRQEVSWPIALGPVRFTPYAVGRVTHWGDEPPDGRTCRLFAQAGAKASMHFWRDFPDVESRLWDVHGLRHVITPEAVAFWGGASADPNDAYPFDPGIEGYIRRQSAVVAGVRQRLQTRRGPAGDRHTVDWMRFGVTAGFYDNGADPQPSNGRFFFDRPEYSVGRNHVNAEYAWYLSDATTFLADANYDVPSGRVARTNLGLAVVRDPRLRYYLGWRRIEYVDSSVGTVGLTYKISPKYTVRFLEQYDFDFDSNENLLSSISIIRKLPRWYASFTFTYDQRDDDVTAYITFWPEGIPEVRLGSGHLSLLGGSDDN